MVEHPSSSAATPQPDEQTSSDQPLSLLARAKKNADDVAVIRSGLSLAFKGEALPSVRDAASADLMAAIAGMLDPSDPATRPKLVRVGLVALELLLEQFQASLRAERAMAMARMRVE